MWVCLLLVIFVVVIAWLLLDKTGIEMTVFLLSVGLITSYIVAVMASLFPITEILLGENEVLRVFSPAAFPFCIQQYRDYSAELFRYSICFGWPEGVPLLQFHLLDSQSEFIHMEHYRSGLSLGLFLLLGMAVLVGILTIIDSRYAIPRKKLKFASLLLIFLQLALIVLLVYLYFLGSIIYPVGGLIVLLLTLYPTLRAIRTRCSRETIQQSI